MPDTRTRDARPLGQEMTIPERVKAALMVAGRFEVGSEVYLPDRDQTLRVVRLDFTSGKAAQKGIWLHWESRCVECGKLYQFVTKRTFSYPTRTCLKHRKAGPRRAAAPAPALTPALPVARVEDLERAAIDVLDGFSMLVDRVTITEAMRAVERAVYGSELPFRDRRLGAVLGALGRACEAGVAHGVWGDEDILFCPPLP